MNEGRASKTEGLVGVVHPRLVLPWFLMCSLRCKFWDLRKICVHEIAVTELCVNGLMMVCIKNDLAVRRNREDVI